MRKTPAINGRNSPHSTPRSRICTGNCCLKRSLNSGVILTGSTLRRKFPISSPFRSITASS